MTPEHFRKQAKESALRDLEIAQDDARHELREAAWQGWMLDNTWAFHEVAGVIESVRSRKEWMP